MGVSEQIIFPEIEYDKIDKLRGLDITITTTARNDDEGRALLSALHFPFKGVDWIQGKIFNRENTDSPKTDHESTTDKEEI